MLKILETGEKLVGKKQTQKAVKAGEAKLVFLAEDAEKSIKEPIEKSCADTQTDILYVPSMKELGKACGISVGAAAAVMLK